MVELCGILEEGDHMVGGKGIHAKTLELLYFAELQSISRSRGTKRLI